MAVLTIELTEELLAKLKKTGRPVQDVIIEVLERALPEHIEPIYTQRDNLSGEEVIRRLQDAGLLHDYEEWDMPEARAWRDLPEEKKREFIDAMDSIYFPNSEASRFLIDNQ